MNPKQPKITPSSFNRYTDPIVDNYRELEERLFVSIAKRLKTDDDYASDEVLQWQIDKMNQLNLVNRDAIRLLSQLTGRTEKDITRMLDEIGAMAIQTIDDEAEYVYEQAKDTRLLDAFVVLASMETFKPLSVGEVYRKGIQMHTDRVFRDLNVYINETLITTNYGEGAIARMYRNIINQTATKVMAGEITINQAMTETIIGWSERGINSGFVDRGGNVWSVERYAESSIRSTVNNMYNDFTTERMSEYGTDLVLVSSLSDPREACSYIQGGVASLSNPSSDPKYPSVYEFGYGEPWGLRGINCRHRFFAWFEGVSENHQPQYSAEEMDNNRKLREKQRYYERQIRDAKRRLKIAEIVGDKEVVEREKRLLRNRRARMREFIRESGRTRQYDRERVI